MIKKRHYKSEHLTNLEENTFYKTETRTCDESQSTFQIHRRFLSSPASDAGTVNAVKEKNNK